MVEANPLGVIPVRGRRSRRCARADTCSTVADTAVALLAGRRVARPCPVTGRVPIGSAVPARVGLPVLARMRAHGDRRRGAQQAGQG